MRQLPDLLVRCGEPASVPLEDIPALLGEIDKVRAILSARLVLASRANAQPTPRVEPQPQPALADPEVLTLKEVASILRIGRNAAYEMAHRGEISVIRIGRNIRVSRGALQRWIDQHK